ncbi:MAG: hypothetical protein A3E79_11730 [Burkholderiales bacterium RIFCSPHIGHO2_12_FULL_61_11]|nr:MAG: hypothetical protein A3E79_11730 [Burkholderiales bacterium RIFCSPHIGHO2_12_FULL_61_11]
MGSGERSTLKKLEGAARYWLGSDKPNPKAKPLAVDEEVAQALRRVGVKEEDIEVALAQEEAEEAEESLEQVDFEVHEDGWESWLFFLKVQTQWVFRGMAGDRAGLNNAAVEATMRMAGVKRARQSALLDDLQLMELAVLKADGERAQR